MANPKRTVNGPSDSATGSSSGVGKSTLISLILLLATVAVLVIARMAGVFGTGENPDVANPNAANTQNVQQQNADSNSPTNSIDQGGADENQNSDRIQGHIPLTPEQRKALSPQPKLKTMPIRIGGETFDLELAVTDDQRIKGLSDRTSIGKNEGMLFVFPRSMDPRMSYMVMRDCLFDIDLVYLNDYGFIVGLHQMKAEQPYGKSDEQLRKYSAARDFRYAIELPTGTIARLGLKPLELIELPFKELKEQAQ